MWAHKSTSSKVRIGAGGTMMREGGVRMEESDRGGVI